MRETVDAQVRELVARAGSAPELSPDWGTRALTAMTNAERPPRRRWARRLAVAAVVVGAALLGVSFVPRSDHPALDLGALVAATPEAKTVHVTGWLRWHGATYQFEQWQSKDGFFRCDLLLGGELKRVWASDGTTRVYPRAAGETTPFHEPRSVRGIHVAGMMGVPIFGAQRTNVLPERISSLRLDESLARSLRAWGSGPDKYFDTSYTERTEQTLRGPRHVVVADVHGSVSFRMNEDRTITPSAEKETYRIRLETDPGTGRPAWVGEDWLEDGKWVPVYRAEQFAWDVSIPEEVYELPTPPGHLRVEDHWWQRLDQTLATATSRDWEVTLHDLTVNKAGDLFVTFSRKPKAGSPVWQGAGAYGLLGAEAVDDAGTPYSFDAPQGTGLEQPDPSRHCFPIPCIGAPVDARLRVRLYRPEHTMRTARTVTVTIIMDSFPRPESKQRVVFKNLPLPPHQPGGDLWAEAVEETRY